MAINETKIKRNSENMNVNFTKLCIRNCPQPISNKFSFLNPV